MKRILVVVDGIWPPAVETTGIKTVYKLQTLLAKLGMEIHILSAIEKWADPDWTAWARTQKERHGISFHYVVSRWRCFPRFYFYLIRVLFFSEVLKLQSQHQFDIVHEYTSSPLLINRTAGYRILAGVKTVHTLCTYNHNTLNQKHLAFGKVDKVISTVPDNTNGQILTRSTVVSIPIGIDLSAVRSGIRDHCSQLDLGDARSLLYVGQLDRRKGIDVLLKALPRLMELCPELIVVIATHGWNGTGYDYPKQRALILKAFASYESNLRLLEGTLDIPALMRAVDIVVFPYTTLFGTLGQPAAVLEAMAIGCPIVISDLPEVEHLIDEGKTGLKFPAGDVEALAQTAKVLLDDQDLQRQVGAEAQKTSQVYDMRRSAVKIKTLYEELAS